MKRFILIFFICLSMIPVNSYASKIRYKKDGYEINLEWYQVKNTLEIEGFLYGKHQNCRELIIKMTFSNKRTKERVNFTVSLENYSGIGTSKIFYDEESISSYKSNTRDWVLSGLSFRCR